jgi:hypothetical protein
MAERCLGGQGGYALLTVMVATAFLLPLGAFAAMQARLDLMIQHQIRAAVVSFSAAESGLEVALADLALDPRFERLGEGPDGRRGTADDGEYPFENAPPESLLDPPLRVEVRVEPRSDDRVDIVAEGSVNGRARRTLQASVVRAAPELPGAVHSSGTALSVSVGDGLAFSGPESGGPVLGVSTADEARAVADQVAAVGLSDRIGVSNLRCADAALAAAEQAGFRRLDPVSSGALGDGVLVSPTSLVLTDAAGSGVLIVDGPLRVGGSFAFSGIVVVLGDVHLDGASSVHIDGALLQGSAGSLLDLRTVGAIAYDGEAIRRVEEWMPGWLPHRAVVTGWREQG